MICYCYNFKYLFKIYVSINLPVNCMHGIPSLRKMELAFVIWIIVLGSGYIAFPVPKVFLAVFNKFIEWIICAKKYEINWRRFQGNNWWLPNLKKKTELEQFLRKCNEKISGIKNELTLRQRCRDVSFKKPVRWQWKNELL